ncbi:MAG: hypothetical protein N3A38_16715 [Planctomycetota bacterium]|nr:hypothetical protein [Planctomycetota bacterium]
MRENSLPGAKASWMIALRMLPALICWEKAEGLAASDASAFAKSGRRGKSAVLFAAAEVASATWEELTAVFLHVIRRA